MEKYRIWKCPECGIKIRVPENALKSIGGSICDNCSCCLTEMELTEKNIQEEEIWQCPQCHKVTKWTQNDWQLCHHGPICEDCHYDMIEQIIM